MGLFSTARDLYKTNFKPVIDAVDSLEKSEPAQAAQALLEDPFSILDSMGYKERPSSLSYDVLRRMASKDAVVSAIILTRVNQVSTFTKPARFSKDGVGFEVRLRDVEGEVSEEDKEVIVAIERFLENTGYHRDMSRDSFDTFIRKIVRDRLVYDQVAFEIVPDRSGNPSEMIAVDAATIRLATEDILPEDSKVMGKDDEIKYVQVINGVVSAQFTQNELAFGTANPRTDIRVGGYGFSELEMLIHQITSHLWAEEYNSRFFSQGGTTKGILNLKGTAENPVSRHQLANFKRQWISQVSGMTGAWKTPVMSVDGLEYINVSQSNREMEFEKWLNYLINTACAVYQIDPSEINFPNRGGATGSSGGGLGEGGIQDRISNSKDKGLRPLLRFIESLINRHIVSKFDERFVFTFTGFDQKSEAEKLEQKYKEVKFLRTVNELREEEGMDPLEDGDIILDPVYMQFKAQQAQAKMMEGAGGEEEDDVGEYVPEEDPTDDEDYGYGDDEDDDDFEYSKTKQTDLRKSDDVKYIEISLEDD